MTPPRGRLSFRRQSLTGGRRDVCFPPMRNEQLHELSPSHGTRAETLRNGGLAGPRVPRPRRRTQDSVRAWKECFRSFLVSNSPPRTEDT